MKQGNSIFEYTMKRKPKRSLFNVGSVRMFDCDAGQIIPVKSMLMYPGDYFKTSVVDATTMQPMVAKPYGSIKCNYYAFFTPCRNLMGTEELDTDTDELVYEPNPNLFEAWITRGKKGDGKYKGSVVTLPYMPQNNSLVYNENYVDRGDGNYLHLTSGVYKKGWVYFSKSGSSYTHLIEGTDYNVGDSITDVYTPVYRNEIVNDNGVYSLWQYLGLPANVMPDDIHINSFFLRAYNLIYNYYFRNKELVKPVSIDNTKVLNAMWRKDYFTSALPSIVRGVAPTVSMAFNMQDLARYLYLASGVQADIPASTFRGMLPKIKVGYESSGINYSNDISFGANNIGSQQPISFALNDDVGSNSVLYNRSWFTPDAEFQNLTFGYAPLSQQPAVYNDGLKIDITGAGLGQNGILGSDHEIRTGFSISSLRYAFAIQKWMETNMQVGLDYHEWLLGHYGVSPSDSILQHPEYLGGTSTSIITSEVFQQSATDDTSPQGTLAGVGFGNTTSNLFKYLAKEIGVLTIVKVIRPKTQYCQGIPREMLIDSSYEMYFPEFQRLSEQEVRTAEIFAKDTGNIDAFGDPKVFGFQGRFNDMRVSFDGIAGGLVDEFDYWHYGRIFDSEPVLNDKFVRCIPSKRIFAVPSRPGFINITGIDIKAFRPLSRTANPGLLA